MSKVAKSKEHWIIGSIIALLLLPIVFIVGLVIGVNINGSISLLQDNLSSWVTAFASMTMAVLTIVLAKETWALRLIQLSQMDQIRKDSLKPSISLFLKSTPFAVNFIDIHIKNNGNGTAQNIKFSFKNANEEVQDVFMYLLEELNKLVILQNGISSLGVGEHRTSYVFSFVELHEKFGDKALECITEVDLTFEDVEGEKYSSKSFFNFTEYKGISIMGDRDPLYKISSNLEKIQKDIGYFSSGFHKLKTDIYTNEDREREREIIENTIKEFENQNKGS
jgi:hypothetical protein